ncbi:hypothetical protein Pflav_090730 [Phytohabitans flavus]|uniref:Uncharacterized protein n=2 Tax=Phytohabitans flavus TaxID=1076124 RepID=A0A6F8Y9G4_9ACTN|nr:hypothetical protein Pflav_090730 [Phytohabitans flavus]
MHRGDEDLHYSDNSHRWIAPPEIEQAIWEAGLRAHMQQHRTTMGGPFNINELIEVPRARIPASDRRVDPQTIDPGIPAWPNGSRECQDRFLCKLLGAFCEAQRVSVQLTSETAHNAR